MKIARRPEWLKKKIVFNQGHATNALLETIGLNTVCSQARCPNISECFEQKHATFLLLGKSCSRHCRFCNVEKNKPTPVDPDEPGKVALAVKKMGLKHAVVTSVTRDDLVDGGSAIFRKTIIEIKKLSPQTSVEILIPDFKGETKAIMNVAEARPDIIGHNLETVPRLYSLRPESGYQRSLSVLKLVKESGGAIYTKSSLMLGLGEKEEEVIDVLEDLRKVGCDFLALGQYLRPSLKNVEVTEYITPEKFADHKKRALSLGFKHVESGPYVRSSYRAAGYLPASC